MSNIEWSIPIKHNPLLDDDTVKLMFANKIEHDSYVVGEAKFCKAEYLVFMGSQSKDRESTKEILDAKRVVFAKDNGFSISKTDHTKWERNTKTEDLLA